MSPRILTVTETPKTRGDRWAAICALIAQGRAFEVKACEAKSDEGEMIMLDEAHARFDQVIELIADDDAEEMIRSISSYFEVLGETA